MNLHGLAYLFFFIAFLIGLDLYIEWHDIFSIGDIHHETWMITFGFAGALLLYLENQRKGKT